MGGRKENKLKGKQNGEEEKKKNRNSAIRSNKKKKKTNGKKIIKTGNLVNGRRKEKTNYRKNKN